MYTSAHLVTPYIWQETYGYIVSFIPVCHYVSDDHVARHHMLFSALSLFTCQSFGKLHNTCVSCMQRFSWKYIFLCSLLTYISSSKARYFDQIGHVHDFVWHYSDVIMGTMASQITSLTIVYSIVLKKISKLGVTGLCVGTGEFPVQRASKAENWCFHFMTSSRGLDIINLAVFVWVARKLYSITFASINTERCK